MRTVISSDVPPGVSAEQLIAVPEGQIGYLSPKGAATFLSISTKELERLRRVGGGPRYAKLGRRTVRYAVPDLHAWMQVRMVNNTAEGAAMGGGR